MFVDNYYTSSKNKSTGYSKNKLFIIYFKNPEVLKKIGNFLITCEVSFI